MFSPILISFAIYSLVLVFIGMMTKDKNTNVSGMLLGGRKINYWVTALSAHASDMSSWLFLGFPAAIYLGGEVEIWTAVGLWCGMLSTWLLIAPRLRSTTENQNIESFFEFLATGTKGIYSPIQRFGAFLGVFFFLFYIASGLKGMGVLISSVSGQPEWLGIFLGAGLISSYAAMGGFLTVAYTDAFQALFLIVVIILIPSFMWSHLDASTTLVNSQQFSFSHGDHSPWLIALSWGLGYWGMPHILTKFMGIDRVENIKKSMAVGLVWQALALSSAASIGFLSRFYFKDQMINADRLFFLLVEELFSPAFMGLILCAVLAATISTVDSQLVVSATSFVKDLFKPHGNSHIQKQRFRLTLFAVTFLSATIAWQSSSSIHDMVRYAWSGQGASFGPLVFARLYFPRLTNVGALGGMIAGALTSALWPFLSFPMTAYPMIPGFLAGFSVMLLFSLRNN